MNDSPPGARKSRIFISYRRDDSEDVVGRLVDSLLKYFPSETIFKDIDSIEPGTNYVEALEGAFRDCAVVIVVIGPQWIGAVDDRGHRRIDEAGDWVRWEVETALRHTSIRVVPTLVRSAKMPDAASLPESIQGLALHQAFELTSRHWANDVEELVSRLRRIPNLVAPVLNRGRRDPESGPERVRFARFGRKIAIGVAIAGAALVSALVFSRSRHEPTNSSKEEPSSTASLRGVSGGFRDCAECPEMVVIEPGQFSMGSPASERDRDDDEGPLHVVSIPSRLAIGRDPVTFEQWDTCVAAGGCVGYSPDDNGWGRKDRPVINVGWKDAKNYTTWMSQKTGHTYRLPSEAEYEYAARAGTQSAFPWGEGPARNRANCDGCGSRWDASQTAPVGSFAPNAFGLRDMIGNVKEWTEDCRNADYNNAPATGEAWTKSGNCNMRMLRGGSWRSNPVALRTATRSFDGAGARTSEYGFRVLRAN